MIRVTSKREHKYATGNYKHIDEIVENYTDPKNDCLEVMFDKGSVCKPWRTVGIKFTQVFNNEEEFRNFIKGCPIFDEYYRHDIEKDITDDLVNFSDLTQERQEFVTELYNRIVTHDKEERA